MARRAILAAVLALTLAPSALANDFFVVNAADNTIDVYGPTGTPLTSFGGSGTGPGQLNGASGIGSHPNVPYIYVADRVNCQIDVFGLNGTFSHSLGSPGTGAGQLQFPRDVAVASDGTAYVADGGNNRVQVYSPIGADAGSFSTGPQTTPFRITIGPDGNVYVSLHGVNVTPGADDRIAVFTPAGTPVDSIGTGGTGDGQFNNPGGIDFNPVGDRIRVADTNNNRVQEFDSDGDFVSKLGTAGAGAGQFSFPAGIVFDPAANQFFVADRGNNRIQVFNSAGTFVSEFPAEAPTDLALAALAPTCRADLAVTSFEVLEKDGRDPWFNHFVEGFEHRGRVTVRNNGGDTVGGHVTFFAGDANKGILLRLTAALPKPLASGESATIEFRFETELEFQQYWAVVDVQDGCEDPTSANNSSQDLSIRTLSQIHSRLDRISPRISRGLLALFGADSTPTPPKRLTGGVVREASDITRIHLAVVRLQGNVKAALRVRPACHWLKNARAGFVRMKPVEGKCNKPVWLPMKKVKGKWVFRLLKGLPPGKYVAFSRATNRAGNLEDEFAAGRNRRAFTVRRR